MIFECIRTASIIYPSEALLQACAVHVSRFLMSDNPNLKYLGVKSLTCLVSVHPKYAAEHQIRVIECLESQDETLKRKVVSVLFVATELNTKYVMSDGRFACGNDQPSQR